MRIRNKRILGFSLIELMVVISIIAILVALGSVSFTTAQKKGRDSRRRADMKATQNAFEQYFAVNGNYATCNTMAQPNGEFLPGGLPEDPRPGWGSGYACSGNANTYCVCALLENESGNATNSNCSFGDGDYFCVENQQ